MAILSSIRPDFGHFRAAQTVLALLAQELAKLHPKVTLAICAAQNPRSPKTYSALADAGVEIVELECDRFVVTEPSGRPEVLRRYWQSLVMDDGRWDSPRPARPDQLALQIDSLRADAALLFWDAQAEFALPYMTTPAYGYLARPPQAASISRVAARPVGFRRVLESRALLAQYRRHISRMRLLKEASNICAIDAANLRGHRIPTRYISNTWADAGGPDWRAKRSAMEAQMPAPQILANIGAVDATGNSYGLRYLAEQVLPLLERKYGARPWSVSICGRGELPSDVSAMLKTHRVQVKGFVPDIDAEMQSSSVMLLLNNMGPYTGGYTRVTYAFSTGACLIASKNLRRSMPELCDGQNCLLGGDALEIVDKIRAVLDDPTLRMQIGAGARKTYEEVYHPAKVAGRICEMIGVGSY